MTDMSNEKRARAIGISRVADNHHALLISFDCRPTDDEMRDFHDALSPTVRPDIVERVDVLAVLTDVRRQIGAVPGSSIASALEAAGNAIRDMPAASLPDDGMGR